MEIIVFENSIIKINEISSIDLFLQEGGGKILVHSKDGDFRITFPGSPNDAKKKYMEIESMVSQDKSKEGDPTLKDYGDSLIEKVSDEEMNEFKNKKDEPDIYIVRAIRRGAIAIEHDGTLIDLNKCIEYCFPKYLFSSGIFKYYFKNPKYSNECGFSHKTPLPTIKATDLLKLIQKYIKPEPPKEETTKTDFPKFLYESNACWTMVTSLEDLSSVLILVLNWPNGIDSVDDFLDRSKESEHLGEIPNFGTRIEHRGKRTLREYLKENNLLEVFLLEVESIVKYEYRAI